MNATQHLIWVCGFVMGTAFAQDFEYDKSQRQVPMSTLEEYCEMAMPTVDSVIALRRTGKPKSVALDVASGMTDQKAIAMINGVIEWVWRSDVPIVEIHDHFKARCLTQDPEVAFLFPE